MEKPDKCKLCNEDSFKFEEKRTIFNPDDDSSSEHDCFTCTKCGCIHFEVGEFLAYQFDLSSANREEYVPVLVDSMGDS